MSIATLVSGDRSIKQNLLLGTLKLLVILGTAFTLYTLGWTEGQSTGDQLRRVGDVFIGFWLYANLLSVKFELRELFKPKVNVAHGAEFLVIGFAVSTASYFY